jgi:hypothetical protein
LDDVGNESMARNQLLDFLTFQFECFSEIYYKAAAKPRLTDFDSKTQGHLVYLKCGHRGKPSRSEEKRISRLMRKSGFIPMLEDLSYEALHHVLQKQKDADIQRKINESSKQRLDGLITEEDASENIKIQRSSIDKLDDSAQGNVSRLFGPSKSVTNEPFGAMKKLSDDDEIEVAPYSEGDEECPEMNIRVKNKSFNKKRGIEAISMSDSILDNLPLV